MSIDVKRPLPGSTSDAGGSEDHLRLAMRAAGLYLWEVDVRTGETTLSANVNEVIGFPIDRDAVDVMARIDRLIVAEDRVGQRAAASRAMRGEGDLHEIARIINPSSGETVWVEGHGALIRDADGTPRRLVGVGMNITARKLAELALQDNRAELARDLEDTQRLQEISGLLIEDHDSDELYQRILEVAMAIMRADFASIQRLDADRSQLHLLAWQHFHPASAEFWQLVSVDSGTSCGSALRHGERIVVPDVHSQDFHPDPLTLQQFTRSGIAAVQSTPLTNRKGQMVGMISTHWREPHVPEPRELRLLDILVRQAADFIERRGATEVLREREEQLRRLNDQLESRVRERTAQIEALFVRLMGVQEDEQRRIARNVHDHLGQQMTALRMNIAALGEYAKRDHRFLERTDGLRQLAADLDESIDCLTWELRPAALDHTGLAGALEQLVQSWSRCFDIRAEFAATAHDDRRLTADAEINLFRLVQEALHNIAKHAAASHACVMLTTESKRDELLLIIEDDGRGFDAESLPARTSHSGFGLTSMRERAALAGGALTIESATGQGTSIFVRVPFISRAGT